MTGTGGGGTGYANGMCSTPTRKNASVGDERGDANRLRERALEWEEG